MPDYIYLLENRLSVVQQNALRTVRDLAREAQMTVFLTGDAVRDLTCGNPVRDLEVVVHGNALDLKPAIPAAGGKIWGEEPESRTLYLCFPGSVRLDLRAPGAPNIPSRASRSTTGPAFRKICGRATLPSTRWPFR
jgi:tRNA nucleotidyltransferase (CCA-adding enzyme)